MGWTTLAGRLDRLSPRTTAAWTFACAALAAALLAVPGRTVSAKYLNDLFVFLDGGYRILAGQVPHRDYHTPIGALADFLPAIGLWLTGSAGGAMPTGLAVLVLLIAPVVTHVLGTRLRPVLAWPFAAYLVLILAAPANVGEPPGTLSFAMFYNRIGWVALALLLTMALPARAGPRPVRDGVCAGLLTLLLLYLKISYGTVALAFLGFMLLDPAERRWPASALILVAVVTLALEALCGLPSAYLSDLARAGPARGVVQGGLAGLAGNILDNLFDYAAFAAVAALAAARLRDLRLLLFLGFCAGAGLMILNQNFQVAGVVALAAGAAVAAEALARSAPEPRPPTLAACALALVLMAPTIANRAAALGRHAALAGTRAPHAFALPHLDGIVLAESGPPSDAAYTAQYAATLDDGARALQDLGATGPVAVLDFVNPFSLGLNLPPARGDNSVNTYGHTFIRATALPPETMLGDVRVLMDPKWAIDPETSKAYRELYAAYLDEHFGLVRETAFWRIYGRRDGSARTSTAGRPDRTR